MNQDLDNASKKTSIDGTKVDMWLGQDRNCGQLYSYTVIEYFELMKCTQFVSEKSHCYKRGEIFNRFDKEFSLLIIAGR